MPNLPQYKDLPSDTYSVFPEPDKPISRYVVPGNGRRCQTCPPWSVNDIGRRFNLRFGPDDRPPPRFYVDASLLRPYQDIRVMLDWHDSLVLLLDRKYVMKMMSPLFDVNTIVANMERAREVVPVPAIHKYGRSGNCVFIIMDYVNGWQASTLVRYFGPWVEVRLQDQIDEVIVKLSQVGLSHNDLYPRNVFLDDNWKITGIIDWDYAAPLWASTEYERRSTLNFREKTWHYLFLKHSVDRVGTLGANPSDGKFKYY
ncbi:kinase-like protein, partial [Gloeophyllum trabeum ATCC 11539]